MFFGHLPAGYICTKGILKIIPSKYLDYIEPDRLMTACLVASVMPDFDMFYFYIFDNRQHHHHSYWPHLPVVWLCVFVVCMLFSVFTKKVRAGVYTLAISANIFLHLFLDTIAGDIKWLYPFSSKFIVFFHVPDDYGWWIWNFLFHWTFFLELAVICTAFLIYKNRVGHSNNQET